MLCLAQCIMLCVSFFLILIAISCVCCCKMSYSRFTRGSQFRFIAENSRFSKKENHAQFGKFPAPAVKVKLEEKVNPCLVGPPFSRRFPRLNWRVGRTRACGPFPVTTRLVAFGRFLGDMCRHAICAAADGP